MYFTAKTVILAAPLSAKRAIRYHFEVLLRKLDPRLAPVVLVLFFPYICLISVSLIQVQLLALAEQ